MIRIPVAMAIAVAVTGCATITRGTTEEVRVEVDPPDATITTTVGHSCRGIPCKIEVSRRTEFQVTAEKAGYLPTTIPVISRFAGGGAVGMAGNAIIGGVIGVGIDAASGATLEHKPNPVLIALQPEDPANPETPPGSLQKLEAKIKAEQKEKAAEQARRRAARES